MLKLFSITLLTTLFLLIADQCDAAQPRPKKPGKIVGSQEVNQFPIQIDRMNILRWNPSPSKKVVAYEIIRDDKFVTKIASSKPLKFVDHFRKKGVVYHYQIKAIASNGKRSAPREISLPKEKK